MAEGVPSLNDRGSVVARNLIERAAALGCKVQRIGIAPVIDAGVEQTGSVEAGLMLARISMADLGAAQWTMGELNGRRWPHIEVSTARPVPACMASQYAGWQIKHGDFFAMGSGPMRAAAGKEDLFNEIGFQERPNVAVGVLETSTLPEYDAVLEIAKAINVAPQHLILGVARTASIAGGVQVVARSVETAMHKLHELKFDLKRIVGGLGSAPLPPVAEDDMKAIGRTNDAVLYGAAVTLFATGDDDTLAETAAALPSSASPDYGKPFAELFKEYGYDFYKIDPMLFSPASVSIQNLQTGRTHHAGQLNPGLLETSFFT